MLSEKLISFGEVRSIISLVVNFLIEGFDEVGGVTLLLRGGLVYKLRNLCTCKHN